MSRARAFDNRVELPELCESNSLNVYISMAQDIFLTKHQVYSIIISWLDQVRICISVSRSSSQSRVHFVCCLRPTENEVKTSINKRFESA